MGDCDDGSADRICPMSDRSDGNHRTGDKTDGGFIFWPQITILKVLKVKNNRQNLAYRFFNCNVL